MLVFAACPFWISGVLTRTPCWVKQRWRGRAWNVRPHPLKELSAPATRKGMKESVIKFIRNSLLQLQVTSINIFKSKISKRQDFWTPAIFSVRWNPILRSKFVIWFWFLLSARDTKTIEPSTMSAEPSVLRIVFKISEISMFYSRHDLKCLTTGRGEQRSQPPRHYSVLFFILTLLCVRTSRTRHNNAPQTTPLHTAAAIPHKLHWQLVWTWLNRHKTPTISAYSSKACIPVCRIQRQATCYAEQRAETRCG